MLGKIEANISMTIKLTFKAININVEPIFLIAFEYGKPPISNASFKAVDSSVFSNEKKMFKIC